MLHVLQIMISDLPAGTIKMRHVLGIERPPNFKEFTVFLQIMEAYGCGYADDIDHIKNSIRNNTTHRQSMLQQLERLDQAYFLAELSLGQQLNEGMIGNLNTYHQ